jgi:hypothetical protein
MEARVVEGQRKAAMRLFCREEAGIPDPEQLPIWPEGVDFALVGTVVRRRAVEHIGQNLTPAADNPRIWKSKTAFQ